MTALTCPVCASPQTRVITSAGDGSVVYRRCGACALVFQEAASGKTGVEDIYSSGYFGLRQSAGPLAEVREMRRRTFDRNLAEIERLTEKGTLIDIGCGEGYLLESARDRGWTRRYGVDVSAAAVERSAPFGDVQQGTVTEAKLPAGTADVVTAFDSFEHVWDPRAEAAAIFKLLKPGGIAYIVTPDAQSFIARVMGGRWFQFKPDEHVRLYSHASLRQVLREVGFEDPAFHSTGKFSSPSYVATILSTTNPTLGRLLRIALGWTPVWRRLWWIPSGDMCAIARRPAAVSG